MNISPLEKFLILATYYSCLCTVLVTAATGSGLVCTRFTSPSLTNAHGMYAEVLHLAFKALTIMEVPPFGEA